MINLQNSNKPEVKIVIENILQGNRDGYNYSERKFKKFFFKFRMDKPFDRKEVTDTYEKETIFKQVNPPRLSVKNNLIKAKRVDDDSTRKQIIKMLICIIAIYFISWAPITINNLLISFNLVPNVNAGIWWYLRLSFFVMSYFNRLVLLLKVSLKLTQILIKKIISFLSCVNPIVYTFMSKNFREAFKQILSKIFCISHRLDLDQQYRLKAIRDDFGATMSENKTNDTSEMHRSFICTSTKTQISNCL